MKNLAIFLAQHWLDGRAAMSKADTKSCGSCHYRDYRMQYCFHVDVPRCDQINRIKSKGLIGICELYKYNPELSIGEKEEARNN